MKKYSNKHLESIDPKFIEAAKRTIEALKSGDCSAETCPAVIIDPDFELNDGYGYFTCCEENGYWCNNNMQYGTDDCPCYKLGSEESLNLFVNFVEQWKSWAGVE